VKPQRVAQGVQTQRAADLGVQHRHRVAPATERSFFQIDARLSRELRPLVICNKLAYLSQHRKLLLVRPCRVCIFHTLPSGRLNPASRTSFSVPIARIPVGRQ
jgi:hypothetical protein